MKRVRIPTELADSVARALRESQSDKESFTRTTIMRLQQQQSLLRSKLDRAYDDRLGGRISDELWSSKSAEVEAELQRVRAEMERHERASHEYETTGLQILELAQNAYSLYVMENQQEQARLVKTLLSNCTFDRASLCPTYRKPFDLFAKGAETGDWLLRLDSNQQPSGEQAETTLLAALCRALRRRSDACANPQEISRFSSFALCRPWSRFAAFCSNQRARKGNALHCLFRCGSTRRRFDQLQRRSPFEM